MHIHRLELPSADLAAQRTFYGDVFGLPITRADRAAVEVRAGATRLVFRAAPESETGTNHFAFNIPRNLFREAKTWLARRVPLICDRSGQDEFHFDNWNAMAMYFYDPAGNIVELIARDDVDEERPAPFAGDRVLSVSEIGIAVPDVHAAAMLLQERAKVAPYRTPGDNFAPLGNEEGLLILVARGRPWFPDTGIPAVHLPIEVVVSQDMREVTLHNAPQGITLDS